MHPAYASGITDPHMPTAKHVRTNELTDVDTSKAENGSCVGNAHEQTPFYVDESVTLWHGDCLDVMRTLPDASVDAVVTDPPYGLEFMGKEWDSFGDTRQPGDPTFTPGSGPYGRAKVRYGMAPSYDSKATAGMSGTGYTDGAERLERPSYLGGLNPKCRTCGKWQRGGNPCACDAPDFPNERRARTAAFGAWCEEWSAECLRVLKPGGYLLAFGGTRTWHRLAAAVEDSGFELRDSIAWLTGSGFPKSLNVGRDQRFCQCSVGESDRADADVPGVRDGVPSATAHGAAGEVADLLSAVQREGARPGLGDTRSQGARSLDARGVGLLPGEDERRAEPSLEGRRDAQAPEGELHGSALRPVPARVPGDGASGRLRNGAPARDGSVDRSSADPLGVREPHQPPTVGQSAGELGSLADERGSQARRGRPLCAGCGKPDLTGWGTALKPAFEPIVVGRKPLSGTVAGNVLAHGTGALNIDGCRVTAGQDYLDKCASVVGLDSNRNGDAYGEWTGTREDSAHTAGRWPTNVVLDGSQADALDEQSGTTASRIGKPRGAASGEGWGMTATGAEYDDQGGASRFFPTFRYEAKAPTAERPRHGEVAHPTVKPLDLMRWLVRLVTPPGGTVLEPFAGSGTTAEACVIEGFRCIAIEREAAYLPLIVARLSKPIQVDLFGGAA
jgi:DNA modification methylase